MPTPALPALISLALVAPHLVEDRSCDSVASKVDCGAGGITQEGCESKGCCWVEAPGTSEPWCFYKPAKCFNLQPAELDSPPFDDSSVQRMTAYYLANLNVGGSGAVIASPGDCPALNSM